MTELREITIHDSTANPAPLGLMGFGLTTILLNIHNAGYYELNSMILAMGIFYGGLAQVIAGLIDFRKGNEFGATAFCSYGLFWFSLVALIVFPGVGHGRRTVRAGDGLVPPLMGDVHGDHVRRIASHHAGAAGGLCRSDDPLRAARDPRLHGE